jgi:hypothetical protein
MQCVAPSNRIKPDLGSPYNYWPQRSKNTMSQTAIYLESSTHGAEGHHHLEDLATTPSTSPHVNSSATEESGRCPNSKTHAPPTEGAYAATVRRTYNVCGMQPYGHHLDVEARSTTSKMPVDLKDMQDPPSSHARPPSSLL